MRIRSIKPEFWRSLDIAALSIEDRLLFIGLWSYVDDNGVGVDRVPIIAAELFADDLSRDPRETLARVSDGIERLSERGLVQRYSDDSRDYLAVTNWERHQRIDKPNKPRYPLPTSENVTIRETLATPSRNTRETPAPGTGEQGNRPPSQDSGGAGGGATKGTRLPDGWEPSQSTVEKIQSEYPHLDIRREHEIFTDYWRGVSGAKGVKRDWNATWRNWMRRAKQSTPTKQVSFLDQVRANRTADTIDGEVIESKELPF